MIARPAILKLFNLGLNPFVILAMAVNIILNAYVVSHGFEFKKAFILSASLVTIRCVFTFDPSTFLG